MAKLIPDSRPPPTPPRYTTYHLVDGITIHPRAQLETLESFLTPLLTPQDPLHQQVLWGLPSEYIQDIDSFPPFITATHTRATVTYQDSNSFLDRSYYLNSSPHTWNEI